MIYYHNSFKDYTVVSPADVQKHVKYMFKSTKISDNPRQQLETIDKGCDSVFLASRRCTAYGAANYKNQHRWPPP